MSRTSSRVRRVLGILILSVIVLLAASKVSDLVNPAPGVGHWRSTEHRDRYFQAYEEVLSGIPKPDVVKDVQTEWGTVMVLGWEGTAQGDPVVLVPGHSSGAPMWAENLPDWIGKRTVYAFDPIGDAGGSAQSTPLTSPADQAHWLAQAIKGLGVERAHVVGHSFGGANAAELAVRHPEVVASLTLLEPVFVLASPPASIYLWSGVLALPTPQSWKDRALARIGGTSVEEVRKRTPMSRMIDAAFKGYSTALPMPTKIDDDQWNSLRMPVRLDIGADSTLSGGQAAADRMKTLVPGARVANAA